MQIFISPSSTPPPSSALLPLNPLLPHLYFFNHETSLTFNFQFLSFLSSVVTYRRWFIRYLTSRVLSCRPFLGSLTSGICTVARSRTRPLNSTICTARLFVSYRLKSYAWPAIYMKPKGKPQLKKDPLTFIPPPTGVGGLFFEQDDSVHTQVR